MTHLPSPTAAVRRPLAVLVAAGLALAAAACAGRSGPPAPASPTSDARMASDSGAASTPAADAGLRPGDRLLLRAFREPSLSDTLRVDEDGQVTFPLLGRRQVTGVPVDSLKRRVVADYGEYVKGGVEVIVFRRIAVLGAVRQPGMYPVDLTHSVADALALAGGPAPNADHDDIRLLRDGRTLRQSLDSSGSLAEMPIRSGDQIFVGERGWFARNWQWVAGTVASIGTSILVIVTR